MSHALVKDAPAAVGPAKSSLLRRFLSRPEVGSLLGAVVVFVFFFALAPTFRNIDSMATVLYQSATIGLMAVPVALLMIGGEYDLSAGVSVTTAALAAAPRCSTTSSTPTSGLVSGSRWCWRWASGC